MRVNPGLALTLFQTRWPWWAHNLINKWSPVVCFVNYFCNQPPPFKEFLSWTSTFIIHIAKFRIWTLFVGTHIMKFYNRRVPYCFISSRECSVLLRSRRILLTFNIKTSWIKKTSVKWPSKEKQLSQDKNYNHAIGQLKTANGKEGFSICCADIKTPKDEKNLTLP